MSGRAIPPTPPTSPSSGLERAVAPRAECSNKRGQRADGGAPAQGCGVHGWRESGWREIGWREIGWRESGRLTSRSRGRRHKGHERGRACEQPAQSICAREVRPFSLVFAQWSVHLVSSHCTWILSAPPHGHGRVTSELAALVRPCFRPSCAPVSESGTVVWTTRM